MRRTHMNVFMCVTHSHVMTYPDVRLIHMCEPREYRLFCRALLQKRPIPTVSKSWRSKMKYGVALISRINRIIGLFCKRALLKTQYSAKETYNFIDPTDRSHPIGLFLGTLSLGTLSRFHTAVTLSGVPMVPLYNTPEKCTIRLFRMFA